MNSFLTATWWRVYDIRNPNQVVVWRRNLEEGGVEALGSRQQGQDPRRL